MGRDPENPAKVQRIEFGEKVTKSSLKIEDDAEWQAYLDSGAIRNLKPPDIPPNYTGSPRDYLLEQAKLAEGHLSGSNMADDPVVQAYAIIEANEEAGDSQEPPDEDKATGPTGAKTKSIT